MTMTPEEILNEQIWEILQNIKEENLVTEKLDYIKFRIPKIVGAGIIPPNRKVAILRKLQELGAINIKGQDAYGYLLSINDQKFDELYDKYREINSSQEDIAQAVPSHEYFLTNSDLVESLQRKLNSFASLPEKGFFLGIADYIKFIDENSGFEEIISTIDGFRARDKTKFLELEEKLLKDIEKVEAVIMKRIKGVQIKSEIVEKSIKEFEMRKDGRIQSSASRAEELYSGLGYIITTLHENGYENLVVDFIKFVPDTKSIADYKISEFYYPYREELGEYRSKVQRTIWGSWNELVVVYLVIHRYRERIKELEDTNDVMGQMNFYGLHKEMENVLGNTHDEPRRLQFIKDDYIIHINRVHDFVINKLNSNPNKNAEETGEKGKSLQERYKSLLEEIRGADRTSDLDDKYQKLLKEIRSQGLGKTSLAEVSKPKLGDSKLEFNPDDGVTIYRGAEYVFTGKGRALLTFLYNSKNTTFPLEDIKEKCNPSINNKHFYFKAQKDVWDTVEYIRKNLKVKRSEFFPIKKSDENWIWIEK